MTAGLAGCGGGLFQNGDTADASLGQKAKPAVALSPVQGVPQKYAGKVNDQFAASMKEKGIQVVEAKDAQYVIKPTYVALPEPKQGTKVTYAIDVTDKAGNRVRHIEGEEIVSPKHGGDAWGHVTEDAVQKVAVKSAVDVNAWIENPNAPAQTAAAAPAQAPVKTAAHVPPKPAAAKPPVQTAALASSVDPSAAATPAAAPAAAKPVKTAAVPHGEVAVVVPSVTGAPGDGKTSLSEAMKRALSRQGIKLASAPSASTYKIQGQVEVGTAANGEQPITIRWVVLDASGKQLEKTVVQNNKIGAGTLDGPWGDVADQAASAAAAEVSKLLNKVPGGQAQQASNGSAG